MEGGGGREGGDRGHVSISYEDKALSPAKKKGEKRSNDSAERVRNGQTLRLTGSEKVK